MSLPLSHLFEGPTSHGCISSCMQSFRSLSRLVPPYHWIILHEGKLRIAKHTLLLHQSPIVINLLARHISILFLHSSVARPCWHLPQKGAKLEGEKNLIKKGAPFDMVFPLKLTGQVLNILTKDEWL